MAKVPTYSPSVAERPAFQQSIEVQASREDMGAAIGRGLQGVGQGVQRASNNIADLNTLIAQADAKNALNEFTAWTTNAAYGENGYLTLQGKAALDAYAEYDGKLRQARSNFSKNLSPAARAVYDQASTARVLSAQQSALVHRADQQKSYMVGTSTTRQELLANEALLHAGNPAKMNSALALGVNEVREQGALLGWDEHTTKLKVQEYQSATLSSVALQIAQEDPISAVEFLSEHTGQMTPLDEMKLVDALAPMVADAAARDAVTMGSAPMVAPGSAADLIAGFEGFSSSAYNDPELSDTGEQVGPNIYRAGFGSNTVTRADGSVVAVNPSTVVTEVDAKRDLARRLAEEFIPRAIEAVGVEAWSRLDGTTQNVLASLTYNYGSLPAPVARAVVTGDRTAIAAAIEGLAGHNGGINADRRRKEAALVRNGLGAGVQFSPRVEGVLSALPADMSVQIREAAADEIGRENAARAAERRAASAIAKDTLALGIVTGNVTSEQEILQHPDLDDGDKVTLINSLRSEQGATAEARAYVSARAAGENRALNPYSSDDRALADKAYELEMSTVPPEQRDTVSMEWVRDTGMIPSPMIAAVRQGLNSNDLGAVAAALEMSAKLSADAPMAVGHLENAKEIEEAAAQYAAMVDGKGWSAEEAARFVIDQRDPKNRANADLLKSAWTEAAKGLGIGDVLGAFGDNILPGGPVAGLTPLQQEAVLADYLSAAEAAFKGPAQGDVGIARSMALAEIKRTYGVSTVSGQEVIMPFPPEMLYPPVGGSHDYIRDMAMADVRQVAPDVQNVMLTAVPETAQDVRSGKPPRYALTFVRPDGVIDQVPGLFVVDQDQLQQLATLDTEERRLRFEIERAYKSALSDRPMDFTRTYIERMSGGLVGPPTPAEVMPGFADLDAQLTDIGLRRDALLGRPASLGSAVPMVDPASPDAEAAWLEQRSQSFGMMGGAL